MKRIISERKLVAVLFVVAFAIFFFAQQDTKKMEQGYRTPGLPVSSSHIEPANVITSVDGVK